MNISFYTNIHPCPRPAFIELVPNIAVNSDAPKTCNLHPNLQVNTQLSEGDENRLHTPYFGVENEHWIGHFEYWEINSILKILLT